MKLTPSLLVLSALPLSAHHSFTAEFDASKRLVLEGKVARVDWTNPHVFLYVDVPDRHGRMAHWRLESSSPNGLQREGWVRSSLKPGDRVKIEAYQAKDEAHFAKTIAVTLPGGHRIQTGYTDSP